MNLMKRLRILWPGCPTEAALDEKRAITEQMRSDLADMVEAVTTMSIAAPPCERPSIVTMERRKNPDITIPGYERRAAHIR